MPDHEKGKESNVTATPKTVSPAKEQAEAWINQEQISKLVISKRRY